MPNSIDQPNVYVIKLSIPEKLYTPFINIAMSKNITVKQYINELIQKEIDLHNSKIITTV